MTRGRRPKPTHLKVITGNPGKRPLNENEPQPEVAIPAAPSHLSARAAERWAEIAPQLARLGVLTEIDSDALSLYCEAWALWVHAKKKVHELGAIVRSPKSGYPVASPYIGIANKAHDQMRALLAEFGMTPSSRSRIEIGGRTPSGGAKARGDGKKAQARRLLD